MGVPRIAGSLVLAGACAVGPRAVPQEATTDYAVASLGVKADSANVGLFNAPIFTHRGDVYVAFVRPADANGEGHETVVGKLTGGDWQFHVLEPHSLEDAWHAQSSLAVDRDGYIHVVYNMHSSPWQYSVSARPEDISEWDFRGQELRGAHDDPESSYVAGPGSATIPGNRITYPFLTTDGSGAPYVCYREALKTEPGTDYFDMQWSLGIAKYDCSAKAWRRVGPPGDALPFATEPGFRAQGGHLHFDARGRMHVSWIWYAEYERDGSGHLKPNYPAYAYSDDGGETFNRADGDRLNLPVGREQTDVVVNPSWLEPTTQGYFQGYTKVCAMPDGTPYVWVMPKAGPQGTGRALVRYDPLTGWRAPLLTPWGATSFAIDAEGAIAAVSSGLRVHRSHDGGRTWTMREIDTDEGPFHHWLDYSPGGSSDGQLRFLAQRNSTGELRVYTVTLPGPDPGP